MQTINSKPTFTGYYRIAKNVASHNELVRELKPFCNSIYPKRIILTEEHPDRIAFKIMYNYQAYKESGDIQWLRQNVKKYQIDIPDQSEQADIIITTFKDMSDYSECYRNVQKFRDKSFGFFSTLKLKFLNLLGKDEDLPPYVKAVKQINEVERESVKRFKEFFADKEIIEVSSINKLKELILSENA